MYHGFRFFFSGIDVDIDVETKAKAPETDEREGRGRKCPDRGGRCGRGGSGCPRGPWRCGTWSGKCGKKWQGNRDAEKEQDKEPQPSASNKMETDEPKIAEKRAPSPMKMVF